MALRGMAPPIWLTVITYHRVGEAKASDELGEEVFDSTPQFFEEHVEFIARHGSFVDTAEVIAHLGGAPLPKNPVMITFDDGYRECIDVVLPILKRHGGKATFFITTDHMNERRMFWWDRIAVIFRRSALDTIAIDFPRKLELARDEAAQACLEIVKQERELDLPRFLAHLEERAQVTISEEEEARFVEQVLMTWEEVLALRDAGMDIQSHTCSHRVVQTLAPDMLERELGESRRVLEERLEQPVRALAYPVGYPIGDDRVIRGALEKAGYEIAFTNATGPAPTYRPMDRFEIPRMAMDSLYDAPFFRSVMALPALGYT
ncbi:MAG: polysaccharide deacetylase family protein [Myxococcales bacterium]|nr:polysaccharide deacetylase family protein [Myxococcales bacterium]